MPVMAGKVPGRRVDVLRDTGCSTVIVRRDLVRDDELTGQTSLIYTVDRSVMRLPEAKVKIETPFYSGIVSAFCMDDPLYDVIVGNIEGARSPDQPEPLEEDPEIDPPSIANPHDQPATGDEDVVAVATRAHSKAQSKPFQPLPAPDSEEDLSFSYAEEQIQDESLKPCFAQIDKDLRCRNNKCAIMFKQEDGQLYRYYTEWSGRRIRQLLVPKNRREAVMKLAHDGIMAGHLGAEKTKDRIQEEFFWPGVTADVKRFVASCDICQRTVPKGRVPHVSLGQSPVIDIPFKRRGSPGKSRLFTVRVLYGRHVRGPLAILKEVWTNQELDDELKTTYQYVLDLRNRLEETCRLAHEELRRAGARYAKHYNRKSRDRVFQPRDKVLILLPTDKNKLLLHWKGPFEVQATIGDFDYSIKTPSGPKIFHANLLKKYAERETNQDAPHQYQVIVGVIDNGDEQELPVPEFVQTEGITDVKICPSLTDQQKEELEKTLTAHSKIFSNVPGKTDWVECHLETVTESPVHVKQYPLPFATTKDIEAEVQQMKTLGIIEVSKSPYNSPVFLADKPDKTKRFVVDFRRLNNLIIADAEPMPRADAVFASATNKRYFSKLDFVKGYWQIPLSQQSKPKTAFSTKSGLYQFCYMPFGIKTAPAVFARLMRLVTEGIPGIEYYYDDVLITSTTWEEHLSTLKQLFARIPAAGLTVRPSKCELGMNEIDFLGHHIGQNMLAPLGKTLDKIQAATTPKTKRQVRAFLGLTSYYREFIPNYAEISAPLTELIKKGESNLVKWTTTHEKAFAKLKECISSPPVLRLPDLTKEFILRTDASDTSLGAVLLQSHEGTLHPIAYASRKLLPRESSYSTIERECLALVWGIQKFNIYLYGVPFLVQTDHQPLQYIKQAKQLDSRVLRWSLLLQEYQFRVEHIKGSENVGADYLSRV
ncbi:uncharacterized protein LOC142765681 [Rhipicephalus microplus]|uniref:uncharacterized protein LOC142765681 n=1 Tax=Rhipicephalus microplus TaxID=6941 RepID=UPI003F6D68E1